MNRDLLREILLSQHDTGIPAPLAGESLIIVETSEVICSFLRIEPGQHLGNPCREVLPAQLQRNSALILGAVEPGPLYPSCWEPFPTLGTQRA